MTYKMDNIIQLNCGIKFAYNQENNFNVLYLGLFIENGEKFVSPFFVPSNYSKSDLNKIGDYIAEIYGAECLGIKKG